MQQNGAYICQKYLLIWSSECQEYLCDANVTEKVKGHDKRSRSYANII